MKRHAPAAARNRAPIEAVLREELPTAGLVLEIASGTGEHAVHFAQSFPGLDWQPSDAEADALASITAWREDAIARGAANLRAPFALDVRHAPWPLAAADAIVCINMVHISPPDAAEALMRGAAQLLAKGGPLVLYGPYLEDGVDTAVSNLAFDCSLRERDPRWGLRRLDWMDALAAHHGLSRTRRIAMPANNLMLVYRGAM
jgi:SAM-dependent methyltransferase